MTKRVHPHAITVPELEYLLNGPDMSATVGPLTWRLVGRQEGKTEVAASVRTITGAYARLTFPTARPWAVALSYIGSGVCIRRVCVNNGHKVDVWGRCHQHTYVPETGKDKTIPLASFPISDLQVSATEVPYRDMFLAFCGLANIDPTGLEWVDPPQVAGGAQ